MAECVVTTAETGCGSVPVVLAPEVVLEVEKQRDQKPRFISTHPEASLGCAVRETLSQEQGQLQEGNMTDSDFGLGNDFSQEQTMDVLSPMSTLISMAPRPTPRLP